jgi:hypothetical protein
MKKKECFITVTLESKTSLVSTRTYTSVKEARDAVKYFKGHFKLKPKTKFTIHGLEEERELFEKLLSEKFTTREVNSPRELGMFCGFYLMKGIQLLKKKRQQEKQNNQK